MGSPGYRVIIASFPVSPLLFLRTASDVKTGAERLGMRLGDTYRALSRVADGDFPMAPKPTPTASPSNENKKKNILPFVQQTE